MLINTGIAWETIWADKVGVDCTSVVGRDGNVVGDNLAGRRPVLKGPLQIDVALRPRQSGDIHVSRDTADVVDSVGNLKIVSNLIYGRLNGLQTYSAEI